jgi:hypothetical protein
MIERIDRKIVNISIEKRQRKMKVGLIDARLDAYQWKNTYRTRYIFPGSNLKLTPSIIVFSIFCFRISPFFKMQRANREQICVIGLSVANVLIFCFARFGPASSSASFRHASARGSSAVYLVTLNDPSLIRKSKCGIFICSFSASSINSLVAWSTDECSSRSSFFPKIKDVCV